MKNQTIIIVVLITGALIGGGMWAYNANTIPTMMNMDSMMMEQEIDKEDNLSVLHDSNVSDVRPTEVVELKDGDTFNLTASIVQQEVGNRTVKRLAYNGQIPGPILKVEKGSEVTVNFTNNIDMETSLHSHGLRGDWQMDGAVPITPPVEIGETFSYQLEFPDTGVFWYHPHVREDYQQDMGLYGNMIVEEDGYWNEVDQEEYLIIDDLLEDGEYNRAMVTNTLMGRFGDTLLINDTEDYELTVNQGEITRAFITNVANTRTFELEFEGAEMKLVGGDLGRIEQVEMIEHQIIAPAERYIIELYYDTPGTYAIDHRGESIGTVTVVPSARNRQAEFAQLRSNAGDYTELRTNTTALLAKAPDKNLRLDIEMKGMGGMQMMQQMMGGGSGGETVNLMGMEMNREQAIEHCQMMPGMAGCEPFLNAEEESDSMGGMMMGGDEEHSEDGIEWEDDMAMMNNMSTDENIEWVIEDTGSGKKNDKIDWSFKTGDLVKVRIYNDEKGLHPMQHPIHFHGQRFVVLARDGEANENLQWKDTVLIPKGQTIDVLVDMSNPGKWMAHCHIAEHLHSGMMFNFEVK
ncbi:multicopper oxidase family protein [candidate division WWE3 bacterium]|uniref:Multicopper oxidase family protein n=1 Tax=candidate division WWE3 bacterium TaxID=2053526 RepID=A0A955RX39_UNCKA|nr:multicopper oxidase family protein [candidate division WWE3 bacterium]